MTTGGKLLVHTDVLFGYLCHAGVAEHPLRRAMRNYFCYTTVFNAIELFALAETDEEKAAVERVFSSMKLLGLNAKHAPAYAGRLRDASRSSRNAHTINGLIACMSVDSGVPILTSRPFDFEGISGVELIAPDDI